LRLGTVSMNIAESNHASASDASPLHGHKNKTWRAVSPQKTWRKPQRTVQTSD
jgi:hypothetical protein